MKKLISLFKSFFNQKQNEMEQTTKEVLVNSYSQPHVLQQRMKDEKLTHGQTVKADLSPVRIVEHSEYEGKPYMYFCPLEKIDILENVSPGDGGILPVETILKGINIDKNLKPGLYTLKNVNLFSNGTLQVIANEDTKLEPYEPSQNETTTLRTPRFAQQLRYLQAQRDITLEMLNRDRPVFVPSNFEQ